MNDTLNETPAAAAAILGIGTAVPPHRIDQAGLIERLPGALSDYPDSLRWAKRIFKQCGVDTRYTCEPNLLELAADCRYVRTTEEEKVPTTRDRMQVYKREAVPLALEAATQALADSGMEPEAITHLLTVSCTGQFLPGIDAALVQQLGLSPAVNRIPLQFLGCAAGLKAICLSRQITAADGNARVLVVSVELCTLHIQPFSERESLYAASFFGDGASACVVGRGEPSRGGLFRLDGDFTTLLPQGREEMVWEVGNNGFDLFLSPQIPRLIGTFIPPELERLLGDGPWPELWAIHPGGRGILDALQEALRLSDEQTAVSRSVLRQYGNVSSATILFVLQQLRHSLQQQEQQQEREQAGAAIAFGPGLTMELLRFTYVPMRTNTTQPQESPESAYV